MRHITCIIFCSCSIQIYKQLSCMDSNSIVFKYFKKSLCNRAAAVGPWGSGLFQRIGEWGCLGRLVSYIYRLTFFMYVILLWMVALTDAPITSTFLIKHYWRIIGKPECSCLPWIIIPLPQTLRDLSGPWNFSDDWTDWSAHQTKILYSKNW